MVQTVQNKRVEELKWTLKLKVSKAFSWSWSPRASRPSDPPKKVKTRQITSKENCTQERASLPTDIKKERKNTLHLVANGNKPKEKVAALDQGPAELPRSKTTFVCDVVTGIPTRVEEAQSNLVFETLTV